MCPTQNYRGLPGQPAANDCRQLRSRQLAAFLLPSGKRPCWQMRVHYKHGKQRSRNQMYLAPPVSNKYEKIEINTIEKKEVNRL